MGIYNFEAQFVPKLLAGEKTHTIRATRVHPDKPGNTLHLYTGLRHKGARLLMRVRCTRIETIEINANTTYMVSVDGVPLDYSEREQLAKRDGFLGWDNVLSFWEGRLPFKGHIIHWKKD